MKMYQVSTHVFGKKFTALVIADDDFDIKKNFRDGTTINRLKYLDLRKKHKKIEVLSNEMAQ